MPQRKFSFVPDEYYHIYNRGNSKQIIFRNHFDYTHFQSLLYLANGCNYFEYRSINQNSIFNFERGDPLVHIGAYCLMPNHFHILIKPAVEDGVQRFMLKLSSGYASYFNTKYARTGGLYEGRFKAEWADSDEYLKYLFSYIHLNPVKLIQSDWKEIGIQNAEMAMQYLEGYSYSSFQEFDSEVSGDPASVDRNPLARKEAKILNREVFPEYFKTRADFRKEIIEWIRFNPKLELAKIRLGLP